MAAKTPVLAFGGAPSVNLLPVAEVERRERRVLSRSWAGGALTALIVTLAIIGGAFALNLFAGQALAAEQARTTELLVEQSTYSEVSQTISQTQQLEAFRADAMARDFAWSPIFRDVSKRLPEGVSIVQVSLAPRADPAIAAGVPVESVGASGTISFTAADTHAQSATVAALKDLPGLISVDAGSLFSLGEEGVEFAIALVLDTSIYSGAYALEGEED